MDIKKMVKEMDFDNSSKDEKVLNYLNARGFKMI